MKSSARGFSIIILTILSSLTFSSCQRRQSSFYDKEADAEAMTAAADTIPAEVMPSGGDEFFDDFLFNFLANQRLQKERTLFPLNMISGTRPDTTTVSRREWSKTVNFPSDGFYTLIADSEKDILLSADTTLTNAVLQHIMLDSDSLAEYVFGKTEGIWMLKEIRCGSLGRCDNAQFLAFYRQFVGDSVFQHQSLGSQISFSGPDPDDDFSQIEGVITPDFWDAFAPELPEKEMWNIQFAPPHPSSASKHLMLRGISNGMEIEIVFNLRNGRWKLTSLST